MERLILLKILASSFLLYSSLRVLVLRVPTCLWALQVRNPLSFRQSLTPLPFGFEDVTSLTVLGVLAWGTGRMLAGALTLELLGRSFMIRVSVAK